MLLCVPIKNNAKLLKKAQKAGDIIELWPPYLTDLSQITKPVILKVLKVTDDIYQILKTQKITYMDLDISTSQKIIQKIKNLYPDLKIIISYHNFKKTPAFFTLKEIVKKILKKGANIVKIATFANDFKDCLLILKLLNELNSKKITSICLAMGREGKFTRLAGQFLGNYLMYAPINKTHKTAPGQITIDEFKKSLQMK